MDEKRDDLLGEVIDERVQVYGNPVETFARIAQMWSALLDHEVQAWEVPLCLAAMKMVRTTQTPDYSDNSDDIDGYMDIFRKVVGEDMIHARSVTDYLAEKQRQSHVQKVQDITDRAKAAADEHDAATSLSEEPKQEKYWPETDEERQCYADWQRDVTNGDTLLGFRAWMAG